MGYSKTMFGTTENGAEVYRYTLTNEQGVSASFTDLGAIWLTMMVPDRDGNFEDVVLGYDTAEKCMTYPAHYGEPVGRCANRIGGAQFKLNGVTYLLDANSGPNNLHSGPDYYRNRIWDVEIEETELGTKISFALFSPDGDQGYPGNAHVTVSYTLTPDNSLQIDYHMIADADTIANFTNHAYFNLSGHQSGSTLDQEVWIDANQFTIADATSIPTGELVDVKETPMDFTVMKPIGQDLDADYEPLLLGKGYDHNWVLNHAAGELALSAKAYDGKSGRSMEVYTDLPGVQFYTANFLNPEFVGKDGIGYASHGGYCFETQYFPDAINKPQFPSPILKEGEEYTTTTIYKFMTV
ncbi:MAG: aldose epimerase family protein [Hungatella sp.]